MAFCRKWSASGVSPRTDAIQYLYKQFGKWYWKHSHQVCGWHQTGRRGRYTGRKSYHAERPQRGWKISIAGIAWGLTKINTKSTLGESNPKHPYWLGIDWQECILAEKDLWIRKDSKLNRSKQPILAAGKQTAGCISKTTDNRRDVINPQYLALVKPHQECCVQFWSSMFKRNVKIGECPPRYSEDWRS